MGTISAVIGQTNHVPAHLHALLSDLEIWFAARSRGDQEFVNQICDIQPNLVILCMDAPDLGIVELQADLLRQHQCKLAVYLPHSAEAFAGMLQTYGIACLTPEDTPAAVIEKLPELPWHAHLLPMPEVTSLLIIRTLHQWGIPPALSGYDYLRVALEHLCRRKTDKLPRMTAIYDMVARRYQIHPHQVERCIRTAVTHSKRSTGITALNGRKLTNRSFLRQLLTELRARIAAENPI